jgi:23S rRNA pseudouridine1911/1915/1917 synthase
MSDKHAQTFRVAPAQANQTLAAALRQWLPGQSWSQVRKLVEARRVQVSGNLCMDPARRLKPDEVVAVLASSAMAPPREEDIRIRHLDKHIVVVEKPAGITTLRHPEERDWPARRKQLQPTLDELLPKLIARAEGTRPRKGGLPRVRAVHRLDRETSGLMVFARTVEAERGLGRQFRKHTVHRRYLAIVQGHVEAQTIRSRLVRDRGDKRRGSTTLPGVGKEAVTHIQPLEKLDGYTLIECRLETGRTHQIRIHLAELGHPLCGERIYNKPLFGPPIDDASGAPRVALHAAELGFEHPVTGEMMRFATPLPPDLAGLLARLRKPARREK